MIFWLGRGRLLFAPTQEASAAGLFFQRKRLGVGGRRVEIGLTMLRLDSPAKSELAGERIDGTGIITGIRSDRLGLDHAGRDVPVGRLVPVGLVLVVVGGSRLGRWFGRLRPFRPAANRPEGLTLSSLDLGRISPSPPF